MKLKVNDYLIAQQAGTGFFLCRVRVPSPLRVQLEEDSHFPHLRTVIDLSTEDVILNLGPKPVPGDVYGCNLTSLYQRTLDHESLGPVHFFYKPEKEVMRKLMNTFSRVYRDLKKRRINFLLDDHDLSYEVTPYDGQKYAGMYMTASGEYPARIIVRPEKMDESEYAYVMFHEIGHHLHFAYCDTDRINASWMELFNTSIRIKPVDAKTTRLLLESLLGSDTIPSQLKRELDDDHAAAYTRILSTIRSNHVLSTKDLDVLFATNRELIRGIWPQSVSVRDLEPVVSKYACVNFRELFAEAFAFYMVGRQMPKAVTRLMERTLTYASKSK